MGKHARLGPSNTRWPKCPGSVREEAAYPDISGDAAVDGTGSHLLLELMMDHPQAEFDGKIIGVSHHDSPFGWLVDSARIDRVQMCLDYVKRRYAELTAQFPEATITVESETRSDPGGMFGRTDWWGTVDITIMVMDGDVCRFAEVIDYKDGRGWVHVPGNTQLLSYLGGKLRPYVWSGPDSARPFNPDNVDACRITIVQPKTNPPIRYEDVAPRSVVETLEELSISARLTDDPDAPLIPGKHCRWCKHKSNCNAESEKSLTTAGNMMNDVAKTDQSIFEYIGGAMVDLTALDANKLSDLADARAGIEAVFDKIEAEITRRIEVGDQVPGYALVPGNAKQVYNVDPDEISKLLRARKLKKDEIYPAKLITPAQLMKSNLTDDQKESFKKKYISMVVPDEMRLKKVTRKLKQDVDSMFGGVLRCNTPTGSIPEDEPSFF